MLAGRSAGGYDAAMAQEIEMKFRVPALADVARRLRALGARHLCAGVQDDCYFDTPRRRLLRRGCGLRLRTQRGLSGRVGPAELTYKGPARRGRQAKVRPEHQTRVDDPAAVAAVLSACGLRPMVRLQKRRSLYRLGRCTVALDELPVLGCFVEIEGPSDAIMTVACALSLADLPVEKKPYSTLVAELAREKGLAGENGLATEIVFPQ